MFAPPPKVKHQVVQTAEGYNVEDLITGETIKTYKDPAKAAEAAAKLEEKEAVAAKKQREEEQAVVEREVAGESAIATFGRSIKTIDDIMAHPGFEAAVGAKGITSLLPGTPAQAVKAKIETLQSQTFLNEVEKMKGLGALTEREGAALSAAVGSLSTDMSEKDFKKTLNEIKNYFTDAQKRAAKKYGITLDEEISEAPLTAPDAPAVGTVEGGYIFMGGDPADPNSWRRQGYQ